MLKDNVIPQNIFKVSSSSDCFSCKFLSSIRKIFAVFTAYISIKNVGILLLSTSHTELFVQSATLEKELQVFFYCLYKNEFSPSA